MSEVGTSGTWPFASKIYIDEGELITDGGYFRSSLKRVANQAINDQAWTYLSWDTTLYDTPSGHESSPNPSRYTVQEAGLYMVRAWCNFKSGRTDFRLQAVELRRDGALVGRGTRDQSSNPNAHWSAGNVAWHTPCSVGAYLTVAVYQDNGGGAQVNVDGAMMVERIGGNPAA